MSLKKRCKHIQEMYGAKISLFTLRSLYLRNKVKLSRASYHYYTTKSDAERMEEQSLFCQRLVGLMQNPDNELWWFDETTVHVWDMWLRTWMCRAEPFLLTFPKFRGSSQTVFLAICGQHRHPLWALGRSTNKEQVAQFLAFVAERKAQGKRCFVILDNHRYVFLSFISPLSKLPKTEWGPKRLLNGKKSRPFSSSRKKKPLFSVSSSFDLFIYFTHSMRSDNFIYYQTSC